MKEIAMKFTRFARFSIRSVLLLMLVGGVLAARHQPREIAATLELVSFDRKTRTATMRLTNTARNDVWHHGHGRTSPFFGIDQRIDGQWQAMGIGWCGTGVHFSRLKRNQSVDFDVFWMDANATAIRVNVACFEDDHHDARKRSIAGKCIELDGD